ncbi:hypothetical protein [Teredinibacter sp. KSP-S5-2]|uniref:hypothetical protein n=1 Tax=Teredinibacter sp. KSP-S5-2 TaxID=3034506 RepID=UPI00293462B8|nr:hypothetical protein [Teredinibacter sp. KSP-S5-2]WNO11223.1 hypothetical protein P5V12_08560 [Teredinibacter sp. KSP-S5-2]
MKSIEEAFVLQQLSFARLQIRACKHAGNAFDLTGYHQAAVLQLLLGVDGYLNHISHNRLGLTDLKGLEPDSLDPVLVEWFNLAIDPNSWLSKLDALQKGLRDSAKANTNELLIASSDIKPLKLEDITTQDLDKILASAKDLVNRSISSQIEY